VLILSPPLPLSLPLPPKPPRIVINPRQSVAHDDALVWAVHHAMTPRTQTTALFSVVAATSILRLWFGHRYFGFSSGDDLEILRAGFMRALDHDYAPWAIRNLVVSDVLIAPVVWTASLLGIDSPRQLCWIGVFPFVVLASINTILVHHLALRWLNHPRAAVLAAILYAFHWLPLGYGSTVYPRTASTTCVLVAAILMSDAGLGVPGCGSASSLR
jgi:hypothetical protein